MVVEKGVTKEGGGQKLVVGSLSVANPCSLSMKEVRANYCSYPPSLASYQDVVTNPNLFMDTLEKLHASMGTKFKIPVIGGTYLDLHRLFVEVTSRGGIEKIVRERRWKEVTAIFSFPSSATNASFILRKYYISLLHHYEQIYFFKAKGWTPSADGLQNNMAAAIAPPHGLIETSPPLSVSSVPAPEAKRIKIAMSATEAMPTATKGIPVVGVIDGKFESGYLITVTIGSEKLKGVLYQCPLITGDQATQHHTVSESQSMVLKNSSNSAPRRRRRKKCEMKKRDPTHPKPNRSGYNFFFAEQHARLKPLYPGKDREISRMIGESWNKLKDGERAVYQQQALKDKERYKLEMEDYKERLRMGQVISNAVPIQQRPLELGVHAADMDDKTLTDSAESPHSPENEVSSSNSEKSHLECRSTSERDLNMGTSLGMGISGSEKTLDLSNCIDKVGDKGQICLNSAPLEVKREAVPTDEREPARVQENVTSVSSEEKELVSNKKRLTTED